MPQSTSAGRKAGRCCTELLKLFIHQIRGDLLRLKHSAVIVSGQCSCA